MRLPLPLFAVFPPFSAYIVPLCWQESQTWAVSSVRRTTNDYLDCARTIQDKSNPQPEAACPLPPSLVKAVTDELDWLHFDSLPTPVWPQWVFSPLVPLPLSRLLPPTTICLHSFSDGRRMFSHARIPLSGANFRARLADLSPEARSSFEQLDTFTHLLSPLKWSDQLSPSQKLRFYCVATPAEWNNIVSTFRLALQKIPVLSVAAVTVDEELAYLVVGVYDVHCAVLSVHALKQQGINWVNVFDCLPAELKEWLRDPAVLVLVAEGAQLPDETTGCQITNVVLTSQMYCLYQCKGVIDPIVHTADGGLDKQMAYCFAYIHRPCTPDYFKHLTGSNEYRRWPEHRQVGWKPKSAFDLKVREEFFLFYEAMGVWAFVFRLIQHGVVFGDIPTVLSTVPLASMITRFLQDAGPPQLVGSSDPLGLSSENRGPLDVPEVVEERLEEQDALELTDQGLEDELSAEVRDEEASHPGYFTREGAAAAAAAATTATMTGGTSPFAASAEASVAVGEGSPVAASAEAAVEPEATCRATTTSVDSRGEQADVDDAGPAGAAKQTDQRSSSARAKRTAATRKRHRTWPQPPKEAPWNKRVQVPRGEVLPWEVDLRGQLTLPSNNNAAPTQFSAQLNARAGSQSTVAQQELPRREVLSLSYDSPQDLRARLDVRRGAVALADEAQGDQLMTALPLDYNLCFAQRSLRASRRADLQASQGELVQPEEEGDEEVGFPPLERRPSNLFLTPEERAYNPFAERPVFHGRCWFCSGNHCSRSNAAGTGPNCKKLRQHLRFSPTRRICLYRRCKAPTYHHTVVCPELHRRCPVCGCRGHGPEDSCQADSSLIMSRLRVDFEEYAGLGYYTRLRFHKLQWGFYPVPPTVPEMPVVSYTRLTNLPVVEAIRLVADLTALPQNQVNAVPEAIPPKNAPLGTGRLPGGAGTTRDEERDMDDVECEDADERDDTRERDPAGATSTKTN